MLKPDFNRDPTTFEPHKAAYRLPKYQTAYRVKNWAEHDEIFGSEVILLFGLAKTPLSTITPRADIDHPFA